MKPILFVTLVFFSSHAIAVDGVGQGTASLFKDGPKQTKKEKEKRKQIGWNYMS